MIIAKNESKIFTKHINCECKCKLDTRKCNSNQSGITINVYARVKNIYVKKIIFRILLHLLAKSENIQQKLLMIQ